MDPKTWLVAFLTDRNCRLHWGRPQDFSTASWAGHREGHRGLTVEGLKSNTKLW